MAQPSPASSIDVTGAVSGEFHLHRGRSLPRWPGGGFLMRVPARPVWPQQLAQFDLEIGCGVRRVLVQNARADEARLPHHWIDRRRLLVRPLVLGVGPIVTPG
jgi:hypothetical protein